jgi:hypothetical protein
MVATFSERIGELRHMVGAPELLRGQVTVDQVYAHYQHEGLDFKHPRGGEALYLQRPLFEHYSAYLREYAGSVLDDGGQKAIEHAMEHLSDEVEMRSPREFDDLRRSGHPVVEQGIRVIYDRPPKVRRLTPAELRVKSRIRYMALPDRLKGWIWWHVQHHTSPPPRRGHG